MPHVMVIKDEKKAGSIEVPGLCGSPGRGLQLPDEEDDGPEHEQERQQAVQQGNFPQSFRGQPGVFFQSAQSEEIRWK